MTSWVKWRGIEILGGAVSDLALTEVRGWRDSPDMRQADTDRPGRHGQYPGSMFASGRIIEADFEILAQGRAGQAVLDALDAAVAPTEDPVEESLTILFGSTDPLMVQARCSKWSIPTDRQFSLGRRHGTLQWKATDPRRYSSTLHSASTSLAVPTPSGLAFPLAFPLAFGSGTSGGEMVITNAGAASTWPLLIVSGPVTGPEITYLDTGAHLTFDDGFQVLAGQQMVIDSDNRTVLIGGNVSRRNELTSAHWFALPAKTPARIGFHAADYNAGARLTVQWRDAWF